MRPSQLPRHTVTEQLQENMFSVGSPPRLHHEGQQHKPVILQSLETAELAEWSSSFEAGSSRQNEVETVGAGGGMEGRGAPIVVSCCVTTQTARNWEPPACKELSLGQGNIYCWKTLPSSAVKIVTGSLCVTLICQV
jgi:hypothetical protein